MPGTGICAQWGWAEESTVGTIVTPAKFLPITSAEMDYEKVLAESEGLAACANVTFADETVAVGKSAAGSVETEVRSKSFGQIFKHMLGSAASATIVSAGPLYRQTHLKGELTGKGLTVQAGYPESYSPASPTIRAFTYRGCKIPKWELSCEKDGLLMLKLDLDAWDETTATALAAATYATAWEIFAWNHLTATIGGTPTTSAGRTTIGSGVAIKGLRGVTLTGENSLVTDRRLGGGAGVKSEQLENGFRQFGGELDTEFADRTQLYDLFPAHTSVPLEFKWTGLTDVGSGQFASLRLTYPQVKLNTGSPHLGGPDVLEEPVTFKAYGDRTGTHPAIQLEYESVDTTL